MMGATGYRIDVSNYDGEVSALHEGKVLAKSSQVRVLRETRLPNYYYFPKDAVDQSLLIPSEHRTFCPFKGTASYWHLDLPEGRIENAVWSYETPLKESSEIGGYLGFMGTAVDDYQFSDAPPGQKDDGHINSALSDWILREAGYCTTREELVRLLGQKFVESGIAVFRLNITIWSLHPEIAGVNFYWMRDTDEIEINEPGHDLFTHPRFVNSPVNLVTKGMGGVRQPLNVDKAEFEFPVLEDLQEQGATDYVAMPLRFSDGRFHSMTLASDHENGFTTENLGLIFECMGVISRYFEVLTLRSNQKTLLNTYLGPRTGQKVLAGDIRRGQGENIQAVILFSDLRNSTQLAESLSREDYLQLLNKYFETVIDPITEYGGEVLKFIGDAVLAIFPVTDQLDDQNRQTQAAFFAAQKAVSSLNMTLNGKESPQSPEIDFGIALHIGEVTYGNVGAQDRLDFTVIGPAVNLASRIESLCKSTGNKILISSAFKEALVCENALSCIKLCSEIAPSLSHAGFHALKGFEHEHQIYSVI